MIAATLQGPSYSPINYDFDSIEVFASLEDVIEALFERYSANGRFTCPATFLDGSTSEGYFPAFGEGMSFTCYRVTDIEDDEDDEDLEGQRLEAHTAVHGGWKDYTVTLTDNEGTLVAVVEKAGL
jgi:hypothetical protein